MTPTTTAATADAAAAAAAAATTLPSTGRESNQARVSRFRFRGIPQPETPTISTS